MRYCTVPHAKRVIHRLEIETTPYKLSIFLDSFHLYGDKVGFYPQALKLESLSMNVLKIVTNVLWYTGPVVGRCFQWWRIHDSHIWCFIWRNVGEWQAWRYWKMYHLLTQTVHSLYFSTYLKEKASEAGEKHVGVGPRRQVNQSSLCFYTGIVLLQFYLCIQQ